MIEGFLRIETGTFMLVAEMNSCSIDVVKVVGELVWMNARDRVLLARIMKAQVREIQSLMISRGTWTEVE